MATKQATIDFILDQLLSLRNMRARKMFGEYALYCGEKVIALVCDDTLYVKITDAGRDFVGEFYEEGFAYPGAKASMLIDEDRIEDGEWLSELIRITYDNLPAKKNAKAKKKPAYYLYIIHCADTSLYTGITTNLERRFGEHSKGTKGAKYTAAHQPQKLVYSKKFPDRSSASIEEARIKKLKRAEKLQLIGTK